MNNLKITIVKLETSLFSANTRTSFDRLNKLIADDFIEVGASGVRFDKQHVVERLPTETPPEIEAGDFELRVTIWGVEMISIFKDAGSLSKEFIRQWKEN